MSDIYYLLKSGTLSKSSGSLTLKNETESFNLPIEDINMLAIFGNVTFTTPAISLLAEMKIPVILFSERGFYISSIFPDNYLESGYVLKKQVEHSLDFSKRLFLAKQFVIGASRNMGKVISRLKAGKLQVQKARIENSFSIEELMGVEGNIHIEYLNLLDSKLPEKFKINGRSRRPPANSINAMMSYLYSVLYGTVTSEILRTHLSPSISYLHEPSDRRSSLSLDVSEIFRPIICDRVILKLVNLKMINDNDFIMENGVYLSPSGKRKVLEAFDEKMRETVFIKSLGRNVSMRRMIRLELYKLEKHLIGDSTYKPYISRF
ncbi:type I-B CRISPR-associated endonuclease Cas1b [Cuniculiplasma sp. SKW3]|uniref:type I-B CRISPR-associated endonuclease Cas1b n=1 Tax=Cuniculiplasma sp. SKW3 TaxID=3400170 RepID=UPI003FD42D18